MLLLLAKNTGWTLPVEQLSKMVWNSHNAGDTGAARVHIAKIKNKIGTESADAIDIIFERGKGYVPFKI